MKVLARVLSKTELIEKGYSLTPVGSIVHSNGCVILKSEVPLLGKILAFKLEYRTIIQNKPYYHYGPEKGKFFTSHSLQIIESKLFDILYDDR